MAKAGTAWLYDQTQYHPDFWMPPLKEIGYLNHKIAHVQRAELLLAKAQRRMSKQKKPMARRATLDARDFAFLRDAAQLSGKPRNIVEYAGLFRHKGSLLSGDVTPGYSALPPEIISSVATLLPYVRIVLLVRDPIERLWSHLSMIHRKGQFDAAILNDPFAFGAFLRSRPVAGDSSFPTRLISRWETSAPQLRFRWFLFDALASRPEETRREIFRFVGADADKPSGELSPGFNRKANATKLEMTNEIRSVLVERYGDEIIACSALFGGDAEAWPVRYGL
jgi:hypothetical protein